jgi:hypothetical protein
LYYGTYYPRTSSIYREEKRKPENVEQVFAKHINIAEEIQRRLVSIDERFERIEKMIQERARGN